MFPSALQFVVLYYGILLHRLRRSPLPEGAFDTRTFYSDFLFTFYSSAQPIWSHATMAWFSLYKQKEQE